MQKLLFLLSSLAFLTKLIAAQPEAEKTLPDPLKSWANWALWNEKNLASPSSYQNPEQSFPIWPSQAALTVENSGGSFQIAVTVFNEAWLPLPGGTELWPQEVKVNGVPFPVVEHDGNAALKLPTGQHKIEGRWFWKSIPQRIVVPSEVGLVSLSINGANVEAPAWDSQGALWLKRDAATVQTDKDFLDIKFHSLIADGIPLWLHTEIELVVAGKNREESLGSLLPEGWKAATLQSPLPVALDAAGNAKVQVRSGKWKLRLSAFRLDSPQKITFSKDAKPPISEQFIAFQAKPDFRLIEITGLPAVDVSQTSFPDAWRQFPVYRWETNTAFAMEERMRGMGMQKPQGLSISRELWLDQDGSGYTFRDQITGEMQQIWRLDAEKSHALGSVRAGQEGQLITRNPKNGAAGVEIRSRTLNLEATGRMKNAGTIPASGWLTDADKLDVTLNLPPGWRLFALFGADRVEGDWLTAWTLLDLFLLLILTLGVFRLWGFKAAILAFFGFALSYHEADAPRYVWLSLLIPIALLRVVPQGKIQKLLTGSKWLLNLGLLFVLLPFVTAQIQQAIYPQLEGRGLNNLLVSTPTIANYSASSEIDLNEKADHFAAPQSLGYSRQARNHLSKVASSSYGGENLKYDTKALIQTGPGVPEWTWRRLSFGWNGPVTSEQTVRPILIPAAVERVISVIRVLLLLGLAGLLLDLKKIRKAMLTRATALITISGLFFFIGNSAAEAQIPDTNLLETLRQRLTEKSDAFPTAGDISHLAISLDSRKLSLEAEIHTAAFTAVPLPGKLPSWAPLSVSVDGKNQATIRREDGFLWVVLDKGIHRVKATGLLADVPEWQLTWQLKPRRITIDQATEWQIKGLSPDGAPEAQLFFSRELKSTNEGAAYDRPSLQSAVMVHRQLELGHVWTINSMVTRLENSGGAIAMRIPLLPGENVLSSNAVVRDGFIEVRLGEELQNLTWQSELPISPSIALATRKEDGWIEQWSLIASPVWNVSMDGLAPIFRQENSVLSPVWQPWPGEATTLQISRPDAIAGATVTVSKAENTLTLGKRQRSSSLKLSVRSSLGEDFLIKIPAKAEADALTIGGQAMPIRKSGDQVIVPIKPGEQEITLDWKQQTPLLFASQTDEIRLPVEAANITTQLYIPDDRWVLWTSGPLIGPAVRFWVILVVALLTAILLGRIKSSPLKTHEWMLLAIGLTQIPLLAALLVIAWLFILTWRGSSRYQQRSPALHNIIQVGIILLTITAIGIFITIVSAGLLGSPEMFVSGNDSTSSTLSWYEPQVEAAISTASCFSVSIWWYRLSMLLWALWLAASLIRWLTWGWKQINQGGSLFTKSPKKKEQV